MRPRDLDRLSDTAYDVLVVGGGVHGLAIAYEAASRRLRTALVEAADYGSAASFHHQRTVHGGLRSLQSGRLDRARQAIYERRALARIAPWLLRPLPFITGTYRSATRSRLVLRAAFRIERWLSRHRNDGVEPELHLPPPRLISKAATLRLFPGIRQEGLTGAAQWYDYQMVEAERLTFAFAAAADRAGADLANYVEAIAPLRAGNRIAGMHARDRMSGRTFDVRAAMTVVAAGARTGRLTSALGVQREWPLLKAMNLVTNRRASDIALAAAGRSGRMLTLVPWHGRALIGTSQSPTPVPADAVGISGDELQQFVEEANHAFPALRLEPDDVTLVHRGIVPATAGARGSLDLKPASEILDHAASGVEGAVSVIGVKYTTARGVAEHTVDLIGRRLHKRLPASRSATTTLPGAAIADHEALAIETARNLNLEVSLATIRHLIARYAEASAQLIELIAGERGLGEPLGPDVQTIGAEIVHVVRHEHALHLSDIVIRRTALGALDCPQEATLSRAAAIAAPELGWDARQAAAEIEAVREFYRVGGQPAARADAPAVRGS